MGIGRNIADRRKELRITQDELAEIIGVSPQAVSRWENDWNLPDLDKVSQIAAALRMSVGSLIGENRLVYEWQIRDRMFSEEHMFTRLKTIAELQNLKETYKALYYARDQHKAETRNRQKFSDVRIPYIIHPLMMACHAISMGISEDEILAAILLHDVCEDCGVVPEELPFSENVREAVRVLTKKSGKGMSKEEKDRYTAAYYHEIGQNRIASIVKAIDRCNNVSTMAMCFSDERLNRYIEETENYVMPLLSETRQNYPEFNNALFLIKYQMLSVMESVKAMLMGQ